MNRNETIVRICEITQLLQIMTVAADSEAARELCLEGIRVLNEVMGKVGEPTEKKMKYSLEDRKDLQYQGIDPHRMELLNNQILAIFKAEDVTIKESRQVMHWIFNSMKAVPEHKWDELFVDKAQI